ncbi:MAG: hypothetical protein R6X04_08675, partial [Guyparkeria sp.]
MTETHELEKLVKREYKYGFTTDIEQEIIPPGLDEDVVRMISAKKNEPEFMLEWRLEAFRQWQKMQEPEWAHVHYPKIDYQALSYYAAPKSQEELDADAPESLDEVDPKLLETYEKLGIPLHERAVLAGVKGANVAVDAVFDSVSVTTTFKEKLAEAGVIFCSFSEAVENHPELVKKYLGTVVPQGDNFFAAVLINLVLAAALGLLSSWSPPVKAAIVALALILAFAPAVLPRWNLTHVSAGLFRMALARDVLETGQ